jgi:hypothetical protein
MELLAAVPTAPAIEQGTPESVRRPANVVLPPPVGPVALPESTALELPGMPGMATQPKSPPRPSWPSPAGPTIRPAGTPEHVAALQDAMGAFEINGVRPGVHPRTERGWLLSYLMRFDEMTWRRWSYWFRMTASERLPEDAIPQIAFSAHGAAAGGGWKRTRKMLEESLNAISPGWSGWGDSRAWDFFFDWLLFGFGDLAEPPPDPHEGAGDRLYQVFNVGAMVLDPADYFGELLSESAYGRRNGFFPTPMNLTDMITQLAIGTADTGGTRLGGADIGGVDNAADGSADKRLLSVMDPCVGTGRFLLSASNYSLRLYGIDIDPLVLKACKVNGWLYAPWLVRPLPFVERLAAQSEETQAPAAAQTTAGANDAVPEPDGGAG